MATAELKLEIKKLIVDELRLNRNPESITDGGNLSKGGMGLDSVDILSLVRALEEKYNLRIDDDDMLKLNTVNEIAAYIENHLGK
jgi:acyl carrier protein